MVKSFRMADGSQSHGFYDMRQYENLWYIMRHYETSWDIMRHYETLWDIMRLHETIWDNMIFYEKLLYTNQTSLHCPRHS